MRFLCLHGLGTNNKFVEGVVKADINDSIKGFFPATEDYFQYFEEHDAASCLKALNDLDAYIEVEGPFDGVVAFSQGASAATSLMLHRLQQDRLRELMDPVFKCGIFLGAAVPCDPAALANGMVRGMTYEMDGKVIGVPTTHIWGEKDTSPYPPRLSSLCAHETRNVYIHRGGHEVPGSHMDEALTESVRVIKRAISMAQHKQA
ncbi:DUF341 domain protein [Amniculicola lignicola CBS 123094]|uniref:DUF341 domain protein n=1 Tax=Amniculicola lignicola CBS 123094 TaxID=1392246 RepID=A0A6A5X183_9PLEO|nr:DUF341 domain protein [Amniculicola lignicola CBS 123094]